MKLEALKAWGEWQVLRELEGGYRNKVYLVKNGDELAVAKTTGRSKEALEWLEPVFDSAEEAGFVVPRFIKTKNGNISFEGITLETFIEGKAFTSEEMPVILPLLERFHHKTADVAQRPDFASSLDLLREPRGGDVNLSHMPKGLVKRCRDAWEALEGHPQSAIHGDINPSNLLHMSDDRVALLDWDEARVDASIFDMSFIKTSEDLRRAFLAWEVATCWLVEPSYAKTLALNLYQRD